MDVNPNEVVQGNGAPSSGNPDRRPFSKRAQDVYSAAEHLVEEAKGAAAELVRTADLGGRTRKHPYAMLAAAAGVGYVLGGGLFTRWTARIVRLGLRLAAVPLVREELIALAALARKGPGEAAGPEHAEPEAPIEP
jgi:hypothetical protein